MKALRLTAADWCFVTPETSAENFYAGIARLGYEASEMVPQVRQSAARSAGLGLLNIAGPSNLNRSHENDKNVAAMRASIAEAVAAGAGQVIVSSGPRGQGPGEPAIADDAGRRSCTRALKAVAPAAEQAGVVLTLEVLNSVEHPDYQCDSGAFAFDVARGVSSPAVKVLYDLFHANQMNEDVEKMALRNLPFIAHLHVAASPARDLPTAASRPNYQAIVRSVMAAGYDGCWGMEFRPAGDPLAELRLAAQRFRQWNGEVT